MTVEDKLLTSSSLYGVGTLLLVLGAFSDVLQDNLCSDSTARLSAGGNWIGIKEVDLKLI